MDVGEARQASSTELDEIYRMGFDVWGDGAGETEYLRACRGSPKYEKGRWFVLEERGNLLSSLILYDFGEGQFGLGSIATPPAVRSQGYASKLILGIVDEVTGWQKENNLFLYSDIKPAFYEKLGFTPLPPELQKYKDSTCMIHGNVRKPIPDYF